MAQQPGQPAPQPQPPPNPVNTVLLGTCIALATALIVVLVLFALRTTAPPPATPATTVAGSAATMPATTPATAPATADTTPAPLAAAQPSRPLPPGVHPNPGPDAAMAKALEARAGWRGHIAYSSDDWTRVKVVIGPNGAPSESITMHWENAIGGYVVESVAAINVTTTIVRQPTVIVQPVKEVRRGNPARPQGGPVAPEASPGHEGGLPPVEPGGAPAEPGSGRGRDATPEPTPGHD